MSYSITQFFHPPRMLYLNSKFATLTADKSKNNHCWFSLQESITIPRGYNNVLLAVTDAQIPISFYTVNETNNIIGLTFQSFNSDFNIPTEIVIPYGNYDAYTLAYLVQEKINTYLRFNIDLLALPWTQISVGITYDIISNKYTFKPTISPLATDLNLALNFKGFSYILWGFNDNQTSYDLTSTLISQNTIDLSGSRFLFIQSPSFSTHNINSKTGSTNQILAKIPITSDYLEIQQWTNDVGFQNKITTQALTISVIEIVILDENLNDIDFQGGQWAISLSITILGESPEELIAMK